MIKLMLPILFPSWRFFSGIGVSPRFYVGFVSTEGGTPAEWVAFRPLPRLLSIWKILKQLIHNPQWNELLFLNSCAERLFAGCSESDGDFYRQEIAMRLLNSIRVGEIAAPVDACFMCFQIRAIYSEDAPANRMGNINEVVVLQSGFYRLSE